MKRKNGLPGFNAESTIYRTTAAYITGAGTYTGNGMSEVAPALITARRVGLNEVQCDTYCCAVCSCCANKGEQTCCANCGSSCPKNVALGGRSSGVFARV